MGGKARGLAFIRHILRQRGIGRSFPGIRIAVPPTLVLTTEIFDRFLDDNDLLDLAIHGTNDDEITAPFSGSAPSHPAARQLAGVSWKRCIIRLAVRSSSLLEDSQYQPFSGVYETFMLGNQHPDIQVRLEQLLEAIKLVYASTFSQHAKAYVRATPYRLEEEKMAVVLQQVVGATHGNRFYPDFSGVVRSRNFYPVRTDQGCRWICRRRSGTGARGGERRQVPYLQPAPSAPSGAVFVGRGHAGEFADGILGAGT